MSREFKEHVVNEYIRCLNDRDISVIEKMYAPEATVEDPVGSPPIIGLAAIVEFYTSIAFVNVKSVELTGPIRIPETAVAFPFRLTLNAGDSEALLDAIDVFEFDDENRVVSMRAYWG